MWLILSYTVLENKFPGSDNTSVLTFILGLYDLCSDIIYAHNLTNASDLPDNTPDLVEEAKRLSTYYWLSIAVPFILNIMFIYYLVQKEIKSSIFI